MNLLDHALDYARIGWAVFPVHTLRGATCSCSREDCHSPGKHPRTKNGLLEATRDEQAIVAWWRRWSDANIAVATGAASGVVVLDVDGPEGEATLEALEAEHGTLPDTIRATTGGDGHHYVFAHPGVDIRNTAGDRGKLGAGLDFRGDGGYIVVAPSLHYSGGRYSWVSGPAGASPPADLPAWLLARMLQPKKPERAANVPLPTTSRHANGGSRFGLAALEREVAELAPMPPNSGRNSQLNRAAFNLGQLVAGGELDEHTVVARLTDIAIQIGLGETETTKSIASGLGAGKQWPRTAPPRDEPRGRAHDGAPPHTDSDDLGAPLPTTSRAENRADDGPPTACGSLALDIHPDGPGFGVGDLGNARRLVHRHGRDIHFVAGMGVWLIWDGRRWRRDGTGEIYRMAKSVVDGILDELDRAEDKDTWKRLHRHWERSRSDRAIRAMVSLAQSEPGIGVDASDLDNDPWLLNCRNGVVDLRTRRLLRHDRDRLITKLAPVDYDVDASLDLWDHFVDVTTNGDVDLQRFLQRAAGYTLTGDTGEEKLFFAYGPPASGKSTFLDALRATLGEYAQIADFETFLQQQNTGGPRNDIARLAGSRLVASIEVDEGRRLAEGLIKTITGGDTVTARFLYRESFEFKPQFKLWLAANDAPRVSHEDEAMWRRILTVPFEHSVPVAERDPAVKATLRDPIKAGPAILAWAVRGCVDWQQHGLGVPRSVVAATQRYRDDQDMLRDFIEDRCEVSPAAWAVADDLYEAYRGWAKETGIRFPISQKSFGDKLRKRRFTADRRRIGGVAKRYWTGIGLAATGAQLRADEDITGLGQNLAAHDRPPAHDPRMIEIGEQDPSCAAPDQGESTDRARWTRSSTEEVPYARAGDEEFPEEGSDHAHRARPTMCDRCGEREAHRHGNGLVFRDLTGRAVCHPCIEYLADHPEELA